jgi:hypothetical protein
MPPFSEYGGLARRVSSLKEIQAALPDDAALIAWIGRHFGRRALTPLTVMAESARIISRDHFLNSSKSTTPAIILYPSGPGWM